MAALPQQGAAPLAPLCGYPCTPTKTVHPPLASVPFLRVLLSYPGGDTHSHLPYNALSVEVRAAISDLAALKFEVLRKVGDAVGNIQTYQL